MEGVEGVDPLHRILPYWLLRFGSDAFSMTANFDLELLNPKLEAALDKLRVVGKVSVDGEIVPLHKGISYVLLAEPQSGLPHEGFHFRHEVESKLEFNALDERPRFYLGAVHFGEDVITVYANLNGILFPAWRSNK